MFMEVESLSAKKIAELIYYEYPVTERITPCLIDIFLWLCISLAISFILFLIFGFLEST